MKLLLTTLNSKFTHSSLALRYIHTYIKSEYPEVVLNEYTINNQLDYIVREIYQGKFDVVAFSVYIWNVEASCLIAKNLKKVAPGLKIIFGGPEVTFESVEFLKAHPYVDAILRGEGEQTFMDFMNRIHASEPDFLEGKDCFEGLKGITYRVSKDTGAEVVSLPDQPLIENLDIIPFPYESFEGLDNRILYYESSRGCPFNCQYCLSSTIKGVRFFSLDRVKADLKRFVDLNVMQVKFIDRTFNADKRRALDIFKYLHEIDNGYTNFHFEITADRLDDDTIAFLECVRPGLFQFEIGVQTTNAATLLEIQRFVDFEKLRRACNTLSSYRNIHLHLDLIAGLPYEGYDRFMQSFDDVYSMRPEMLQLGFLKLLKGSGLRMRKEKYGYVYNEVPPYEIMATAEMDFDEMIRLKGIEDMVEHFYNNQKFTHALEFIIKVNGLLPSKLYELLSEYWHRNGWHHKAHNQDTLYQVLEAFYMASDFSYPDFFKEVLKFDYVRQSSRRKLYQVKEETAFRQSVHAFLQSEENRQRYLPAYIDMSAKAIVKLVRFETFKYDILEAIGRDYAEIHEVPEPITLLFDYSIEQNPFDKSIYHKVHL